MMDRCCEAKGAELAGMRTRQGRVLTAVLAINATMFFGEFGAGLWIGSAALLADSLDMLGDSLVYGFSLYVLHRGEVWRVRAALGKALIMAAFGVGVLVDAGIELRAGVPPAAPAMFGVGLLALLANLLCFTLLWRHRADDINLRSTWLCSRNDLIANASVLIAAVFVGGLGSIWPDILVGLGIAALFLHTSAGVLRESLADYRRIQTRTLGTADVAQEPALSRDSRGTLSRDLRG